MRIAYIANARIPTEKAHGVQIMYTCAALAARGHDVTLIVPKRKTRTEDPFAFYGLQPNFTIKKAWCLDWVHLGVFGFFLETYTFSYFAARIAHALRPDVVYGRDPVALGMVRHAKRVFELHTALPVSFGQYTHVIAISRGLAEYALGRGAQATQVSVVHDATPLDTLEDVLHVRTALQLPADLTLVGYVGKYKTMGVEKGVRALIESVAALQKTARVGLLVVGLEPAELTEVAAYATESGIPQDAQFLVGHVPPKQARAYMRAADILVMNYPNEKHYATYMSPLKLFEYLASGNVMVSSDLPTVREIVDEHSAALVPPGDTHKLQEALAGLIVDPKRRKALGQAGYEVVKQHTYEARAERIEAILSAL